MTHCRSGKITKPTSSISGSRSRWNQREREEEMDEAKALAQQQQMLLQQQFMLIQQQMQQQKQQQHQAMTRFPSNIDVHLRPPGRPSAAYLQQQQQQHASNSNPNPSPTPPPTNPSPLNPNSSNSQLQINQQQQQQQQSKVANRIPPANQAELQMAYQDAWRVCHPDFKRPFTSLEDACERSLLFSSFPIPPAQVVNVCLPVSKISKFELFGAYRW